MDWGLLPAFIRDLWKRFVAKYSKIIAGVKVILQQVVKHGQCFEATSIISRNPEKYRFVDRSVLLNMACLFNFNV